MIGGAEIAAGAALSATGIGGPLGGYLIAAGIGTVMSGVGTLLSKGPVPGLATALRNPTAPWTYGYGLTRVGGTPVYMQTWGGSRKMLDVVIVLRAHACQSIDAVLFDMQRVQIDTAACYAGAAAGS